MTHKYLGRQTFPRYCPFSSHPGHKVLGQLIVFDSNIGSALSAEQIDEYFNYVQVPSIYLRDKGPELNLAFLSTIQSCHLSAIPYKNLALHYTGNPHVSLDVVHIYNKVVVNRRGGYCMENNIFFHHVLRFFGFRVYLTGARLHRTSGSQPSGWSGWEHSVNIVTLSGHHWYLVDVGYGGNGPRAPLPLTPDVPFQNIGAQELRLVHHQKPNNGGVQPNAWLYQFRNGVDQPWVSAYVFTDIEFTRRDFEVMNLFASRSPDCPLTSKLLVAKFLRMDDIIYGKLILDHDRIKKNTGGKTMLVQTCTTEEESINALEEHFGIRLTEEEQSGIKGRISSLAC
ncbi:arylamine N-acetyltransferase 1 [Aspergillus steynii IBT 23096]|uniref:Arylamine N-acetyltransferase 1 n=1 Tax=Aspergillus steynii IBT 23096 TaxID=1392250 RepID=A0A2I2GPV1_9EURO|nr:arylamine N-acetyltransferase 1 [Aspergillus steynii IBT 23096]PLB54893.1 arylamine N-acetyltransferase 1 [Aspergillus steynii IBT 23096]